MTTLILFPLLTTALWYLFALAEVTSWLTSRYPDWFARFTLCAACFGFWAGMAVCGGAAALSRDFVGLSCRDWWTFPIVGLCAMVWTPPLAALHIRSLAWIADYLDSAGPTPSLEGAVKGGGAIPIRADRTPTTPYRGGGGAA